MIQYSRYIPFTYLWIHKRGIKAKDKTILDLGCGRGGFTTNLLGKNTKVEVTGVDLYQKDLAVARTRGIYADLFKQDILEFVKYCIKNKQKFDVIIFSQVIEHLPRKTGEKLLDLLPKVASKRIIIGTPMGYIDQPVIRDNYNSLQKHRSGWKVNDFFSRGYRVHGTGFCFSWSESGLARHKNKLVSTTFVVIALMMSPLVYFFPKLGSGMVAVKDI